MKRTCLNFPEWNLNLNFNEELVTLGSCFSNHWGDFLQERKIKVCVNPLGTIFHPQAIGNILKRSLLDKPFDQTDFFLFQDYYFNYEISGTLARPNLQAAIDSANHQLQILKSGLENSKVLFITWGTAWGYLLEDQIVANCHKQPQKLFTKSLSSVSKLVDTYKELIREIKALNPDIKIVLTTSPVIHSKDGLVENSRSKATLILAQHQLQEALKDVYYLPVYEFIHSELRDYAFFESDGVHPNSIARNLLFENVREVVFSQQALGEVKNVESILQRFQHSSIHPESKVNLRFKQQLLSDIQSIHLKKIGDWDLEIKALKSEVENLEQKLAK